MPAAIIRPRANAKRFVVAWSIDVDERTVIIYRHIGQVRRVRADDGPGGSVQGVAARRTAPERTAQGGRDGQVSIRTSCVRICANKVVAGVRVSTNLPTIRPQDYGSVHISTTNQPA